MDQTAGLLIDDFRMAKKAVHRFFIMGLALAVGTHFFIVEPYVTLKKREAVLSGSQEQSRAAIKTIIEKETRLRKTKTRVKKELKTIRNRIDQFPAQLREDLFLIRDLLAARGNDGQAHPLSPPMIQSQPAPPVPIIPVPSHIKTFSHAVRWHIDDWFNRLMSTLDRTTAPLRALAAESGIQDIDRLAPLTREAVQALNKQIRSLDPNFWYSYEGAGGKIDVAAQLLRELNRVFAPIENEMDRMLKGVKKEMSVQSGQLKRMQEEQAQIHEEISQLSNRIKPLESTIGPVPLEVKDLIRLFPFILSAIALILSYRLNQVLRLRAIIRDLFLKEGTELPPSVAAYHLGGWLLPEPGGRPVPIIIAVTGYCILAALFLRTAGLTGWQPELYFSDTMDVLLQPSIYRACLGIGFIFQLLATARALMELKAGSAPL